MDIKPVPAIIAAAFAFSVLKDKQTIGVEPTPIEPTPIDYSKIWLTAQRPILKDGKIARFEDYIEVRKTERWGEITVVGIMRPLQPMPYKHVNLRYTNHPEYPFHALFRPYKKSDGTWTTTTYWPTKEQGGVKTANPGMFWPGGTLKEAKANVDSLFFQLGIAINGRGLKGKIRDVSTDSRKTTIDMYTTSRTGDIYTGKLVGTVRLSNVIGEQTYLNISDATIALQKVIYSDTYNSAALSKYLLTAPIEEWTSHPLMTKP